MYKILVLFIFKERSTGSIIWESINNDEKIINNGEELNTRKLVTANDLVEQLRTRQSVTEIIPTKRFEKA